MAEEKASIGMTATDPNAPPSYEATQQDPAGPPSYNSLFGQIQSEREKNSNPVSFIGSVARILLSTFIVTLFMAMMLAIPITMIVIGSIYIDDCPVEYLIPIYLITMGAAYIVKSLIDLKGRFQKSRLPKEEQADFKPNKVESGLSHLLGTFCFAFFIAGNVWIYSNYKPNTSDSSSDDYCHPTLYYFAFWVTTVCYIIAGLFCFCGCCIGCMASCCATAGAATGPSSEAGKRDVP
ncbi:transmembrane protein 272-like [Lytechinus variegatus]|uniref:transmembrane protein 272-like n=1 Tax=Lytechinus variegatus TaxID=7654 RepID=UPI001BB1E2E7|nr:transmembrane protein 272-like [Lytechinus variegatus]